MLLGTPQPVVDLPLPIWEHGYRVHGFWSRWVGNGGRQFNQRMAHVGLTPHGHRPVVYTWALDDLSATPRTPDDPPSSGQAKTLRAAKRSVLRAYRHYYSWCFPKTRGY